MYTTFSYQQQQGQALHDKHLSRNKARQGAVKRGGAGRFNWGDPIRDAAAGPTAVDSDDPNYDSEEQQGAPSRSKPAPKPSPSPGAPPPSRAEDVVSAYKKGVTTLLAEYLDSGDINEVAVSLGEAGLPRLAHHFVKRAIALAMDRHGREREMVSVLLSALYHDVIPPEQMQRGFLDCVESLEDLKLDCPDAPSLLATFVARGVVDDVLPPSFLSRCRDLGVKGPSGAPASEAIDEFLRRADAQISGRHTAERQLRCWGAGAGLVLEETKGAIKALVEEYLGSGDVAEADRRLRELDVPFFHHEAVRTLVLLALSDVDKLLPAAARLLAALSSSGLVSESQLEKGLQRLIDNMSDIQLDTPGAEPRLRAFVEEGKKAGWLDPAFSFEATAPYSPSGGSGQHNGAEAPAGVADFKQRARAMILEYFDSNDIEEVARCLRESDSPGHHHLFVKRAVSLALDKGGREREMTAELLSGLFPELLTRDQIALGFTLLLDSCEDLALDVPGAPHLLSLFLGRAIVDEILPPVFLQHVVGRLSDTAMGLEVVESVGALLGVTHAAEMLEGCFEGEAGGEEEAVGAA